MVKTTRSHRVNSGSITYVKCMFPDRRYIFVYVQFLNRLVSQLSVSGILFMNLSKKKFLCRNWIKKIILYSINQLYVHFCF
ncbi:hypothetical protein CPARA_1gp087 (nucleomorph) [Cryptomonas paramecium]|uniref:Uncharacterized protein n=1 Tax=Cryptomonas paramaecium TaxID=2898 RepID=F2HHE9_9CRYP|nr:hypothetical protein CPARA_1gp087 [Cryptomonas paramecium]AEA38745.1 hypothetical protein CPARA_1gp087 [Cryptomonas paramecium]